jgi:cysteine-rich repeat protein
MLETNALGRAGGGQTRRTLVLRSVLSWRHKLEPRLRACLLLLSVLAAACGRSQGRSLSPVDAPVASLETAGPDGGMAIEAGMAPGDSQTEAPGQSCGNRRLDRGEQCDDGNTLSGDGCSSTCQLECGDAGVEVCMDSCFGICGALCCVVRPRVITCGDGRRTNGEICDDGNTTSGDGCSSDCKVVEPGYRCTMPGKPCFPLCGDSVVKGTETCDDGNTTEGDGCSRFCLTEPGWDCSSGICVPLPAADGGWDGGDPDLFCGDGILSGAEQCDLGPENSDSAYGGCNTQCAYIYCGDGIVNGYEECDLGEINGVSNGPDGCTVGCAKPHFCGDGILNTDRGEQCDLGDKNGVRLDRNLQPSDAKDAMIFCADDCRISILPL